MGFNLPAANQGAGAPEVPDGLYTATFQDLQLREHEDWAGPDKFGKEDDGQRYHFLFDSFTDAEGEILYQNGDLIELEALTRTATGAEKSGFAKILKGILTPVEFQLWAANQPLPGDIAGRRVIVQVMNGEKGWPKVTQTLGPAPVKKTK